MLVIRKIALLTIVSSLLTVSLVVGTEDVFGDIVQVAIERGSGDPESGQSYDPEHAIVKVGTTVIWTNVDDEPHTVTSGVPGDMNAGELFDSGLALIGPEEIFEHSFNEVGEYPYFCKIHPWKTGEVIVVGADEPIESGEELFQELLEERSVVVEHEGHEVEIPYILTNGEILNTEIDPNFTSLILNIETTGTDGELTITLPRELIDSQLDGVDEEYLVLVDGDESAFQEACTTGAARTLTMEIPAGIVEIEIIGTEVIPEFPLSVGLIMALVVAIMLGASIRQKTSRSPRMYPLSQAS